MPPLVGLVFEYVGQVGFLENKGVSESVDKEDFNTENINLNSVPSNSTDIDGDVIEIENDLNDNSSLVHSETSNDKMPRMEELDNHKPDDREEQSLPRKFQCSKPNCPRLFSRYGDMKNHVKKPGRKL